jgi:ubiquinone/menaquinone biosynthesis C-methylase UbiE
MLSLPHTQRARDPGVSVTERRSARHRDIQDVYDGLSGWYDLLTGWSEASIERQALTMLSAREGEDILELGPGTGRALLSLAGAVRAPGRVFGVDLSTGMLRRSQERLARAGQERRVALVCADAAHLPLRASSADAALSILTLEVLDRKGITQGLAECRRVLRPGGRMVVAAMVEGRPRNLMVRLYRWAQEHDPLLVNCRPIRLRALLTGAGLEIVDLVSMSICGLPVEVVLAQSPMPR